MNAYELTRADLARALRDLARRPAVVAAAKVVAERLATAIDEAGGVTASVEPTAGGFAVTASGPGLFAREFGSLDRPAAPVIGPAIDALAGEGRRP